MSPHFPRILSHEEIKLKEKNRDENEREKRKDRNWSERDETHTESESNSPYIWNYDMIWYMYINQKGKKNNYQVLWIWWWKWKKQKKRKRKEKELKGPPIHPSVSNIYEILLVQLTHLAQCVCVCVIIENDPSLCIGQCLMHPLTTFCNNFHSSIHTHTLTHTYLNPLFLPNFSKCHGFWILHLMLSFWFFISYLFQIMLSLESTRTYLVVFVAHVTNNTNFELNITCKHYVLWWHSCFVWFYVYL